MLLRFKITNLIILFVFKLNQRNKNHQVGYPLFLKILVQIPRKAYAFKSSERLSFRYQLRYSSSAFSQGSFMLKRRPDNSRQNVTQCYRNKYLLYIRNCAKSCAAIGFRYNKSSGMQPIGGSVTQKGQLLIQQLVGIGNCRAKDSPFSRYFVAHTYIRIHERILICLIARVYERATFR